MADNCAECGKEIGFFSTVEHENKQYCTECSPYKKEKAKKEREEADKNIYTPDHDAIRRALSALCTISSVRKMFEVGGHWGENPGSINANLIQASILLRILESVERIEEQLNEKST